MTERNRPTITVTVDADIKTELQRRKREESLNISSHVNGLLRPHFKKKSKAKPLLRTGALQAMEK